jgi:NAD(P)-dependent dehydrogenase (short-subunit alcohol dehydrogenase family)
VAELGRLDFVLANAGMAPGLGLTDPPAHAYLDAIDVMLNGVYNTIEAALPHLLAHGDGGAIVLTSSAAGFKPIVRDFATRNPGLAGYTTAKHGVIGLMRYYATALAEKEIRVNSVHPTGVATPMIQNETMDQVFERDPAFGAMFTNLLPVPLIEPEDVTEAMIYLCGSSGRYVTGTTMMVDAGIVLR